MFEVLLQPQTGQIAKLHISFLMRMNALDLFNYTEVEMY